jgi:ribosome-binding factor A
MSVHGHRVERLAEQIHEDVAEMVEGELKDPRIGLATVTRVELSPDLRHARVLVSVLGDEEAKSQTLEGLSSAAGYVRRELGRRLGLRHTPEVLFVLDRGLEEQEKVENLLKQAQRNS